MFWERFYSLCLEKNTRPNPVATELGFSTSTATRWKQGAIPEGENIQKIADYFDVSVPYLLGYTEDRHPPAHENEKPPHPDRAGGESALDADILRATAGLSDEAKRKVLALLLEFQQDAKP